MSGLGWPVLFRGALSLISRGAEDLQFQIKSVGGLNAQRFSKSDPKHQKVGHTKRVSAVANGTEPALIPFKILSFNASKLCCSIFGDQQGLPENQKLMLPLGRTLFTFLWCSSSRRCSAWAFIVFTDLRCFFWAPGFVLSQPALVRHSHAEFSLQ